MLRLFYMIVKDYGVLGVTIAQLILICYFGWKLFTNHLKHIEDKIDGLGIGLNDVKKEIEKDRKVTNTLGQRISTIEGQLIEKSRLVLNKKKITKKK